MGLLGAMMNKIGKPSPAKIIHRGVFIERRNYGKWICHTGISLFVPVSIGTLGLAIVFAIISLLTYGL